MCGCGGGGCVCIMRVTLVIMSDSSLPENTPEKTHAALHMCADTHGPLQMHAYIFTDADTCVQANGHANTPL